MTAHTKEAFEARLQHACCYHIGDYVNENDWLYVLDDLGPDEDEDDRTAIVKMRFSCGEKFSFDVRWHPEHEVDLCIDLGDDNYLELDGHGIFVNLFFDSMEITRGLRAEVKRMEEVTS